VLSPTLNQEIARNRQADMVREADRERLAALAVADGAAGESRVKALASRVSLGRLTRRLGRRDVAVHPAT
jgi:hypothetical protein